MCPKKSPAADTDSHDVTFHPGRPGEPSGAAKSVTSDIIQSRDYEMKTYLSSMEAMYENAIVQNSEVYDIAFGLTKGFSRINAASVLKDSRIIKTLRYAVAPSISQMKFGQFVGVTSIDRFENNRISRETARRTELAAIAGKIATFARKHVDTHGHSPWHSQRSSFA